MEPEQWGPDHVDIAAVSMLDKKGCTKTSTSTLQQTNIAMEAMAHVVR